MVNIKDIAKQIGVSPSTVSRVVNGKKYVDAEKRARILKLIEETGYVPDKAARSMVSGRSFTVGIVLPAAYTMFQRQLLSLLERRLESFGYHSLFFFVKLEGSNEDECIYRLKSENLDGVVLLHEIKDLAFYEYLIRTGMPTVSATFCFPGIPAIRVNEEQAAADAVKHLVNIGHRKIALIGGAIGTFAEQRAIGYFKALEAAEIDRDENRAAFAPQCNAESGLYCMKELLLRDKDFTAVFAVTDELAIGAIRALKDEGISVPEGVSIIGFDGIELSNYLIPRLTTIRQPLEEIGEQAALTLHRRINGSYAGGDTVLPHKLIVRESTAAPQKS
jgi:LacI family transcriptional regulator